MSIDEIYYWLHWVWAWFIDRELYAAYERMHQPLGRYEPGAVLRMRSLPVYYLDQRESVIKSGTPDS